MYLGARWHYRAAQRSNEVLSQARLLRRGMAYYFPGNPWVSRCKHKLLSIANTQRAAARRNSELAVLRQLRSAIIALRGISQPFAADLPAINQRIVTLIGERSDSAEKLRTAGGATELLRRMNEPPQPKLGWTLAALVAFSLWLGGLLGLLRFGLSPQLKRSQSRVWPWVGLAVAGAIVCVLGLGLA